METSVQTIPVVETRGLSRQYYMGEVDLWALREVGLVVKPGAFIAIAGPSGSGKSTLLNLMGCLDKPTQGTVLIDGIETALLSSREQARIRSEKIGFIFQNFNLLPILSAQENVEYPLLLLRVPRKEREARALDALAKVGLEKYRHHRPRQLSGGQQQRVAIARALVKKPRVILADEPSANLDRVTAKIILELMHNLNMAEGMTFIFSTHDPLIISQASEVIYLCDGVRTKSPEASGTLV